MGDFFSYSFMELLDTNKILFSQMHLREHSCFHTYCYVPASRYKEMEGRPTCVPRSSESSELRCQAQAPGPSTSNCDWLAEVAILQSPPEEGLYKGVQRRWKDTLATTTGLGTSSLSPSSRAQLQGQVDYLQWMLDYYKLSLGACFREERRYYRDGPLPVTPTKDTVEKTTRACEFAQAYREFERRLWQPALEWS